MARNDSPLALFNWIINENNISTTQFMEQNEDDHVTYGYGFLLLIPVCLFLVITNLFLICIIISNRKKAWVKRTHHIFYLIVCDLIVGFSLVLSISLRLLRLPTKKPYWFCAILSYTQVSPQAVSFYHILAVCIHRFRKLRKIDPPNGIDKYRYGVESFLIWIFVLLACGPPYATAGRRDDYISHCRMEFIFGQSDKFTVIYFLTLCCLPCVLANIIYAAVIIVMKNQLIAVRPIIHSVRFRNAHNKDTHSTADAAVSVGIHPTTSNNGKDVGQKPNKATRIIGYLLVVLNISSLSPVITFSLVLSGYQTVPTWIQALTYVNNLSSPFIYSFTITPLREEIKTTISMILSRIYSAIFQ